MNSIIPYRCQWVNEEKVRCITCLAFTAFYNRSESENIRKTFTKTELIYRVVLERKETIR